MSVSAAKPTRKPVRGGPGDHAESRAEGRLLRSRQPLKLTEERDHDLVQSGEAQVHLRLDAHHPGHLRVARPSGCPVEQRGLPYSGRATQDEYPAGPVANGCEHLVKGSRFTGPAQQHAAHLSRRREGKR